MRRSIVVVLVAAYILIMVSGIMGKIEQIKPAIHAHNAAWMHIGE